MTYDPNEIDLQDLHYLLNLCTTIMSVPELKERFVDREFDPKLNRSTIIRCHYKLEVFLRSKKVKPKILEMPTQLSKHRGTRKINQSQ